MEVFKDKECVVCGAATTKTCSACKQLFFCSSAHQKLLWVTHKHLCGKDSFEQPPLKQEEVDWALGASDARLQVDVGAAIERVRASNPALRDASAFEVVRSVESTVPSLAVSIRDVCQLTDCPAYLELDASVLPFKPFAMASALQGWFDFFPGADARVVVKVLEHSVYVYTLTIRYTIQDRDPRPPAVQLLRAEHLHGAVARFERFVDALPPLASMETSPVHSVKDVVELAVARQEGRAPNPSVLSAGARAMLAKMGGL